MTKYEVNTIEELDNLLEKFKNENKENITLLFTASADSCMLPTKKINGQDENKTAKKTWCSDCNQTFPLLQKLINTHLSNNPNSRHVNVNIGDREKWSKQDNLFRIRFKIDRIPTLYNYKIGSKIVESQCLDEDEILKILNEGLN